MMSKADEKAKNTPGHSYNFGTSNRNGGITIQDDSAILALRQNAGYRSSVLSMAAAAAATTTVSQQ